MFLREFPLCSDRRICRVQFLVSQGSRALYLGGKKKATPLLLVISAIQDALAPGFPFPSVACAVELGAREASCGQGLGSVSVLP